MLGPAMEPGTSAHDGRLLHGVVLLGKLGPGFDARNDKEIFVQCPPRCMYLPLVLSVGRAVDASNRRLSQYAAATSTAAGRQGARHVPDGI